MKTNCPPPSAKEEGRAKKARLDLEQQTGRKATFGANFLSATKTKKVEQVK